MYDMFKLRRPQNSSNQNKKINFVWKKMTLKVAKTEIKYYTAVLNSMIQELQPESHTAKFLLHFLLTSRFK